MNAIELIKHCFKIRYFEEKLLDAFSKGFISGTTHTCIGQEINAVAICNAISKKDVVVSNHRSHGHFLAHCSDYQSLMDEILGKDNPICNGIGGSQHLHYKNIFYSNGVLGGTIGLAAGLAFSYKLSKSKNIVVCFLGDGTMGEGLVYEILNITKILNLPLMLIIENNMIAQSTLSKNNISGTIEDRLKAFNIKTKHIKSYSFEDIYLTAKNYRKEILTHNEPRAIVIDSARLGPHSKGDDSRSKTEIDILNKNDPLKKFQHSINVDSNELNKIKKNLIDEINNIFEISIKKKSTKVNSFLIEQVDSILDDTTKDKKNFLVNNHSKRLTKIINETFNELLQNKKIIFIGEDILDPYGGTFKITKGLQKKFKDQFFSSPISEAGITSLAGGMCLSDHIPVVEIMFGDFTGLIFDQILNYISKYPLMYPNSFSNALIIRTPMGGRRGYGPTHSQSIEKYFLGIPNFNVIAINKYSNLKEIYKNIISLNLKTLIIENKTDYGSIINFEQGQINEFNFKSYGYGIDNILELNLENDNDSQISLICYGGTLSLAEDISKSLFIDYELKVKIFVITNLSKINKNFFTKKLNKNNLNIIIEEGTEYSNFSSEFSATLIDFNIHRLASKVSIIPNNSELENKYLINKDMIKKYILEKTDND